MGTVREALSYVALGSGLAVAGALVVSVFIVAAAGVRSAGPLVVGWVRAYPRTCAWIALVALVDVWAVLS